MHGAGPNPAMIRLVLIVVFLVLPYVLRAVTKSKGSKPASGTGAGKGAPLETLRETMRQAAEQARARRGQLAGRTERTEQMAAAEPLEFRQQNQQIQQAPTIEPESSWIPSMLLLALLACLCLMAYRYWGG